MSFFGDLFTGSRPDMALPGYASGMIDEIRNSIDPHLSFFGKQYKKNIKLYNQDPMALAGVSLARGAVNRRNVQEDYSQGANRLLAQSGGEQAIAQQHMKENRLAQVDEQTGLNAMNEADSKYFQSIEGGQRAREATDADTRAKYGMMAGLMGTGYDRRRQGGIFNPQTWSNALSSFAAGAGAGM